MEELPTIPDSPQVDKGGKLWKTLLLTFLGTTMSILLTFGTSQLVSQHRKVQERKLTALMVMGNIDKFANKVDEIADGLAERDTLAAYQLRIPIDSLDSPEYEPIVTYKVRSLPVINYDKTAESIFANSTGIWRSSKDFGFVNWVGTCFSLMKNIDRIYADYREGFDHIKDKISENPDMYPGKTMGSKYLHNKEYRDFLEGMHRKVAYYRYLADKVRTLNAINMHLMDVSNEDVQKFVKDNEAIIEADKSIKRIKDFLTPEINTDSLPDFQTWSESNTAI